MADLHDRHADAGQREQIALRLFEHGQGQDGGTGGEVEDAVSHTGGLEAWRLGGMTTGTAEERVLRPSLQASKPKSDA